MPPPQQRIRLRDNLTDEFITASERGKTVQTMMSTPARSNMHTNNGDFFRRNLMQASENGDMSNCIPNATLKNKQKRDLRRQYVETNMSASKEQLK